MHCTPRSDTKPNGNWHGVKELCIGFVLAMQLQPSTSIRHIVYRNRYGAYPKVDYKNISILSHTTVQALVDKDALNLALQAKAGEDNTRIRMQFERLGYFVTDYNSSDTFPVFNRVCTLRDSCKTLKKG